MLLEKSCQKKQHLKKQKKLLEVQLLHDSHLYIIY